MNANKQQINYPFNEACSQGPRSCKFSASRTATGCREGYLNRGTVRWSPLCESKALAERSRQLSHSLCIPRGTVQRWTLFSSASGCTALILPHNWCTQTHQQCMRHWAATEVYAMGLTKGSLTITDRFPRVSSALPCSTDQGEKRW